MHDGTTPTTDVIVRTDGHAGRLTLNRPRALNALTLDMIQAIDAALLRWATDPAVHVVVLDGAGERGLCAGGDIRTLYEAARIGDLAVPEAFFRTEYRLNAYIARYPKPYVALMDGIVMGGGIGLSAHGAFRVVTERSRLAMPETGIGFFPDVGGTWLLGRAGPLGLHAALTATPMGPADAIACGLADVLVPSDRLPLLVGDLATCRSAPEVDACLRTHASPRPAPTARPWLEPCFAASSVEEIVARLTASEDPGAKQAAADIATRSPTALKITFRAVRAAAALSSLERCLEQEFRLALACMRLPDFVEGVRAAVIDKDRAPKWHPSHLEEVLPAAIDFIPTSLGGGGLALSS